MRSSLLLVSLSAIAQSVSALNIFTKPIRWGIVSAGRISADYVQAISVAQGAEVRRTPSESVYMT